MARRKKHYCSGQECRAKWKNVLALEGASCESCGAALRLLKRIDPSDMPLIEPDIPEHFNQSTNCVIKGRRHLRQIQRERGLSDYDPKEHSGPPTNWE